MSSCCISRIAVCSLLLFLVRAETDEARKPDQPATDAKFAQLIEQLGSRKFREREAATRALEAGEDALDALRQAEAKSDDPEVRFRARRMIERVESRLQGVFSQQSQCILGLALSADGKFVLAAGDKDHSVPLYERTSGRELRKFSGHTQQVYAVAFSPDGKRCLTSGGHDRTVRLWDVGTGKELKSFPGSTINDAVTSLTFTKDGRRMLTGSQDRTVRLTDLESGKHVICCAGHSSYIQSVALSPDERLAASASHDRTVRLWDLQTSKEHRLLGTLDAQGMCVAFSPDGKRVAAVSHNGLVCLWETATGKEMRRFVGHGITPGGPGAGAFGVAFAPDSRRFMTTGNDNAVKLWGADTGDQRACFTGHTALVWCVVFTPDGRFALSGSFDESIRSWLLPR